MSAEKTISRVYNTLGIKNAATIFVTFFIILTAVPILIVCVPLFYTLRKSVTALSKIFRPDLAKLVCRISSNLIVDGIYTKPRHNLVTYITLQGRLDIEQLRSHFISRVLKNKSSEGKLNFAELKQYPVKWLGFYFWKWEENFNISNHVSYYNGNEIWSDFTKYGKISDMELKKIKDKTVTEPFMEGKSPWNILIVPNVNSVTGEDESVLMFKIHHALGDGHSLMKIVNLLGESNDFVVSHPKFPKMNIYKKILFGVKFLLKAPYELADCFVQIYCDRHCWTTEEAENSDHLIYSSSDKIPMSQIKEVTGKLNSSVSVVIYSAFTAALSKAMMKKNGKVPENILCGVMLPQPNRSTVMENHWTMILMSLPTEEMDSVKRLKEIEKRFENLKNSTMPLVTFYVTLFLGGLFPWVIKPIQNFVHCTVGGTSFPGPKQKWNICNLESNNVQFASGPLSRIPVIFTTLTYNGNLRMWVSVSSAIHNNQTEVDQITEDFQNEIKILKAIK